MLAILFYSCGTGKKENSSEPVEQETTDSITLTQPVKDTVPAKEVMIEMNDIPTSKEVHDRLVYFKEKYIVNYKEINPEQLSVFVLDRFTSEKKYKLFLQKNISVKYGVVENIYPVLNIRAYVYVDSAQCANAVNNWFNCFGNDCSSLIPGEDTRIKSTPGYYIINPTSIICLDYLVEHNENNWNDVIAHLKKLFASKTSKLIRVKPQGKLTWEQK